MRGDDLCLTDKPTTYSTLRYTSVLRECLFFTHLGRCDGGNGKVLSAHAQWKVISIAHAHLTLNVRVESVCSSLIWAGVTVAMTFHCACAL
jgi:hypothetical protein